MTTLMRVITLFATSNFIPYLIFAIILGIVVNVFKSPKTLFICVLLFATTFWICGYATTPGAW